MTDKSVLRQKAREAIRAGELPARAPDQVWAGPASGARCAICQEPTTDDEFEFAYHGQDGSRSHFAHSDCWHAFETEVRSPGFNWLGLVPASSGGPTAGDVLQTDGV
jgi:hypothetical protein